MPGPAPADPAAAPPPPPGVTPLHLTLTSSAADVAKIMRLFYEHPDFSDETWEKIADSFKNQPAKFRRGLPSGFSDSATVYNKVGWLGDGKGTWNYYSDAAIVNLNNKNYIVVVLNPGKPSDNVTLAQKLEKAFQAQ